MGLKMDERELIHDYVYEQPPLVVMEQLGNDRMVLEDLDQ